MDRTQELDSGSRNPTHGSDSGVGFRDRIQGSDSDESDHMNRIQMSRIQESDSYESDSDDSDQINRTQMSRIQESSMVPHPRPRRMSRAGTEWV